MSDKKVDKKELIKRMTNRLGKDKGNVEEVFDAAIEEIYKALKQGESVSVKNFGTFYIDWRSSGTVFKFNPAQRLRALFGWSSTFKGEL